jgi:ArsR family transcriptional regulator, arsenate/arsenite/antimonite-responsive transcriptional repressor
MIDSIRTGHALEGIGMAKQAGKTLTEDQVLLIAKALGDRRRYEILKRLGECPNALACCDVRNCAGISPTTLSHHMKELEIAGLVKVVREGKFASYILRRDTLEAFFQSLKKDIATQKSSNNGRTR